MILKYNLAQAFYNLIVNYSCFEEKKIRLSSNPDFDPPSLFSFIDRGQKSYLVAADFAEVLSRHGVLLPISEQARLISMWASPLVYKKFQQMILPFSNLSVHKRSMLRRQKISDEIEALFVGLLKSQLYLLKVLDSDLQILQSYPAEDLFFQIGQTDHSYVTKREFQLFLHSQGFDTRLEKIDILYEGLGCSGVMCFNNFVKIFPEEETLPNSPCMSPIKKDFLPESSNITPVYSPDFYEVIKIHIDCLSQAEELARKLAVRPDFSHSQCWTWLGNNPVNTKILSEKFQYSSEDGVSLISLFDSKGELSFSDIQAIFGSTSPGYLGLVTNRNSVADELSHTTLAIMKDILDVYLLMQKHTEDYRELFSEREIEDFYEELDVDQDGEVSVEDLGTALWRNGIHATGKDLLSLVKMYGEKSESSISLSGFKRCLIKSF